MEQRSGDRIELRFGGIMGEGRIFLASAYVKIIDFDYIEQCIQTAKKNGSPIELNSQKVEQLKAYNLNLHLSSSLVVVRIFESAQELGIPLNQSIRIEIY